MQNSNPSMVPAAAALMLVLSGATTTGMAQTGAPVPGKTAQQTEAVHGMLALHGMMEDAHHVLAMAYRDNVVTFGQVLGAHVARSKGVDLGIARPAVAEMRRSFEQLQQHHNAHATMGGGLMMGEQGAGEKAMSDAMMREKMHEGMKADSAKSPKADMMQGMETHLAALNEHLTALEAELNAGAPEPAKVSAHTTAIVQQCAALFAMPTKMKTKHGI